MVKNSCFVQFRVGFNFVATVKKAIKERNYPVNIRLDEDVFVFRRRLDQDDYVHLSLMSSEDVLVKTNIFVLAIRLQDVFKTSSRHLQDVSSS